MEKIEKKQKAYPYIKKMLGFYFAPRWESVFSIFYFVFFFYFLIFNSGKLLDALNFIFYTLTVSPSILTLDYLFWGVVFTISLIIPFSISLYAILLFYEIWTGAWHLIYRLFTTILIIVFVPFFVFFSDYLIRLSGSQNVLRIFVEKNGLFF